MVKGIGNSFYQMELCFVVQADELFLTVEIGLFFQEITFLTEFQDINFLLPTFLTDGKWDFQVAKLLLATINVEP